MSEKAEKLYDGITGIADSIIERAETYVFRRKRGHYGSLAMWGTMAACACLIVMITLPRLAGGGSSSDRSNEAMSFEGLTEAENAETTGTAEAPEQMFTDTESTKDSLADGSMPENSMISELEMLLPEQILPGYEVSEEVAIYEKVVLQAKYYNEELSDEMLIRIAHRDWLAEELGEVETEVIFYMEKPEKMASYIYIASGDYIVEYSFSSRDIAAIEEFYEMVYSAPCFEK